MTKSINTHLTIDDFTSTSKDSIATFICSICGFILNNPVCDQNGHLFCKECVLELINCNTPCPINNNCILSLNSITDVCIIPTILMSKEVKCLNRVKGCDWIGVLSMLSNHLMSECIKENIPCIYEANGCEVALVREKLNEHVVDCLYRSIQCKNNCLLDEVIIFKDEQNHLAICPNEMIDCPNKCGAHFERKYLIKHASECTQAVFPCVYESYGCNEKIINENKNMHIASFEHQHNALVINYVKKTQNDIANKTELIQKMQKELNETIDTCYKLMTKIFVNESKRQEETIVCIDDKEKVKYKEIQPMLLLKNKKEREQSEIVIENIEEDDNETRDKKRKLIEKLSQTLFS